VSSQEPENPLALRDLCFLDVETTGSVFGFHEIIEIGAVRTSPDASELRGTWHWRVWPRHPERITVPAQELNGFSPDSWIPARSSDTALWLELASFAQGCVPVCHNPHFDRAFITLESTAAGVLDLGLDYHWIGTESLAWPLYRQGVLPKVSLRAICERWGLGVEPLPHNALDGARACLRAYVALMAYYSSSSVRSEIAI
jgi:DNA polymerase III epsilon subunit-like protein